MNELDKFVESKGSKWETYGQVEFELEERRAPLRRVVARRAPRPVRDRPLELPVHISSQVGLFIEGGGQLTWF